MRTIKFLIAISLLVLAGCVFLRPTEGDTGRVKIEFNKDWSFWYSGSKTDAQLSIALNKADWNSIVIPHTWNVDDTPSDTSTYRRGVGFYQKKWFVPKSLQGKRLFLRFEGANQVCQLYVNDKFVGEHKGGYTAFNFELSDFVEFGKDNAIIIKVDNSFNADIPPLSADFTFYGGIYRDIWLIVTDPVHISLDEHGSSGIYLSTPIVTNDTAEISITGSIQNQSNERTSVEIVSTIYSPNGELLKKLKSILDIPAHRESSLLLDGIRIVDPELWSPDNPQLYSVVTQIYSSNRLVDQMEFSIGLRYYELDANDGFFLNGNPLKLIGTNRHQDYQGLGNALPNSLHVSDLQDIKAAGFNFLRLAHYPQDPVVLNTADSLGLIIWEEIPIVNYVNKSDAFKKNSMVMLREMILQHFNHPSVVFWGYMNEIFLYDVNGERNNDMEFPEDYLEWTVSLAQELDDLVKQIDPARISAMAVHQNPLYDDAGISNIPDAFGYNLYPGWYFGEFESFGKFLNHTHKTYPDRKIIVSEYGAGSDERIHSYLPQRFDFSTEYQQLYHESYLTQILELPFLSASAVWCQSDFGSDSRGDSKPKINQKGIQYFDGRKKDIYFYYQAVLKDDPVVRIASHDWTVRYIPEDDLTVPMKIYANVSPVEVFINGLSHGEYDVEPSCVLNIDVAVTAGLNKIQVVGINDGQKVQDSVNLEFIKSSGLSEPGQKLFAMNIGSNCEYRGEDQVLWVPEQEYVAGTSGYLGGSKHSYGTSKSVLGTINEHVYQTYREGLEQFVFELGDGRYELEMCFTENNQAKAGDRVFTIQVNQETVWDKIDLAADYGVNQAVDLSHMVTVVNGEGLSIQFVAHQGQTTLSGIKIRGL